MKTFIKIANIPIKAEVEDILNLIIETFNNFDVCEEKQTKPQINIRIAKADKNYITISSDCKNLSIGVDKTDSPRDYFNLMGVLQALFRFIGLHSAKNNIFLVHGSTSVYNNKAFCFADDGLSVGKTLSAIELSLISNTIIGDEFCFLDIKTMHIFSYPFIPLHIRPEVRNHLEKKHKINISEKISIRTKAGIFLMPQQIFNIKKHHKLDCFVFVYFSKDKNNNCKKLDTINSKNSIRVALTSHLLKFFYPDFDRMNFIEKADSGRIITYNNKLINKIEKDVFPVGTIDFIAKNIKCYQVIIKNPCDLVQSLNCIK
ncbi:MAG: hypothetical protein WC410_03535 [Candidatus Paceibacterota bacterium]|jgi:hypothetical protein|nr:hypothetical protein [Candidatus Paceibacterota bacterium]MDD5555119.1 hypothetical protein [Candidatus Paceibacterota bacterium]